MSSNTRPCKILPVRIVPVLIVLFLIAALSACNINDIFGGGSSGGGSGGGNGFGAPLPGWDSSTYHEVGVVTGSGSVSIPGSYAGRDVVYVITNVDAGSSSNPPSVTVAGTGFNEPGSASASLTASGSGGTAGGAGDHPVVYRGHPEITTQNAEIATGFGTASPGVSSRSVTATAYAVGDTEQFNCFYLDDTRIVRSQPEDQLTATLKWNVQDAASGWRVLVWVDNEWLGGGGPQITDDMIEFLAQNFIRNNTDQDIFGWVTSVFGEPWGGPQYTNTIPSESRDIHILLHDIDGAGVPDGTPQARYAGLFWSGNNLRRGTAPGEENTSNERLMFYLNAGLLVGSEEGPWDPEGFWPREIVSTLAHEFQHMIQFYQRGVRHPGGTYATWLDELASLMAEDMVADKLDIPGPRGVVTAGPGSPGNTGGRIPLYNDVGAVTELTRWPSGAGSLPHYSTSYAFGAFLARAHGVGYLEQLLQEIPASAPAGQEDGTYERWAVAEAVRRSTGSSIGFAELLRRWGVAMLVSDDTHVPQAVRINTGTWMTSSEGGQEYRLGSINAYNYRFVDDGDWYTGPSFWLPGMAAIPPAANRFIAAGEVPAGGVILPFDLPSEGISVTVLVREDG